MGIKFRQQHIIDKYIVDFCSIEKGLIIEVDGGIHASKIEDDEKRTSRLEKCGYTVIRFSNDEVINDLPNSLQKKITINKSPLEDLGADKDVPEFCKSASFEDLKANNFSFVPSKYIEFVAKTAALTLTPK